MSKIYVVVGRRGQYSDFNQWNVRAFLDEGDAGTFKVQCELEARRTDGVRLEYQRDDQADNNRNWDAEMVNKFDPGASIHWLDPNEYSVEELEIGFPK